MKKLVLGLSYILCSITLLAVNESQEKVATFRFKNDTDDNLKIRLNESGVNNTVYANGINTVNQKFDVPVDAHTQSKEVVTVRSARAPSFKITAYKNNIRYEFLGGGGGIGYSPNRSYLTTITKDGVGNYAAMTVQISPNPE